MIKERRTADNSSDSILPNEQTELKQRMDEYRQAQARPILEIVSNPSNQKLVVLGDPDEDVRKAASSELKRNWSEDSEVKLPGTTN